MATINGSFSSYPTSIFKPYITYSYTQNISNNTSTVSWTLYFAKYNSGYYAYNLAGFPCTIKCDGTVFNGNETFDLRSGTVPEIESIRSGSKTITHNSDGTKTIYIGSNGDTNSIGTFNFGQNVTLDTIPREAYLTNNVDFDVEDDIPLTLWNDGNQYVQALLYIDGTLIKTQNLGQVTSATLTLDSGNDDDIYAEMPNATSVSGKIRIKTYSDSGYSSQIGDNKDKSLTASIDTSLCLPTFTTFTLANVDKNVVVKDKYDNTLVTSSTQTLMGGSDRMIEGYSKVRATITTANKMVAVNSATEDFYRFTTALQEIEEDYSSDSTVTLDLDNVEANSFGVRAFDSRGLSTTASGTLGGITEYDDIDIYNVTVTRDNSVDSETKLAFEGEMFKGYFGGDTTGVENTLTAEYRYKSTTASWGAQSWTSITPTVDSEGSISFDSYIDGDEGVDGFDSESSFDIEIRVYDKLSQEIYEITLNRGQPLVHYTQDGLSIGSRYDSTEGGVFQIEGKDMATVLDKMYGVTSTTAELNIVGGGDTTNKVLDLQVRSRAYNDSDQTNLTSGSLTDVVLDLESYDVGDDFDTTDHDFTVPVTGTYRISWQIRFTEVIADKFYEGYVKSTNKGIFMTSFAHSSTSSDLTVGNSDVFEFSSGDVIEMQARQNSGANTVDIDGFGAYSTFLTITLIST